MQHGTVGVLEGSSTYAENFEPRPLFDERVGLEHVLMNYEDAIPLGPRAFPPRYRVTDTSTGKGRS